MGIDEGPFMDPDVGEESYVGLLGRIAHMPAGRRALRPGRSKAFFSSESLPPLMLWFRTHYEASGNQPGTDGNIPGIRTSGHAVTLTVPGLVADYFAR